MKKPLLSIIVPIYNMDKYLERSIRSVIRQDIDYELLLIDDGSTDNSPSICDRFAADNKRCKVIHQENKGLIGARNTGIGNANGKYITFIDPDDWIDKGVYRITIEQMMKANADIGIYGYKKIYNGKKVFPFEEAGGVKILDRENALLEMFRFRLYKWELCDKIYAADIIRNIKLDLSITVGEDFYRNWFIFNKASCVVYVPLSGYNYFQRSESMSNTVEIGEYKKTVNFVFDKLAISISNITNEKLKNIIQARRYYYLLRYFVLSLKKKQYQTSIKKEKKRLIQNMYFYISSELFDIKEFILICILLLPIGISRFFLLLNKNR